MDANQIITDIKGGRLQPVYLLHGEEPYYIDLVSDYIEEHVLNEAQKGFDQTVLYGKDTDFTTIVNAAKRYPMMSDYQVIVVKEAQHLKWKDDELFLAYLENPMKSTVLVLAHKHAKFDKRKKSYKLAEKIGVVLESAKLYDDKVAPWITAFVKDRGWRIHPQAAAMMAEYLGNDLAKVVNELEKLMLNVPKGQEITAADIERNIGISKDFNVFELNTALAKRDIGKAFQIVAYFAANPRSSPIQVILGAMAGYFTKILKYHYLPDKSPQAVARELGVHPFFTKEYDMAARSYNRRKTFDIIAYLREYDLKSKGLNAVNVEQGDLLKELVYKILY
ncbi:DNA polymerase III subunit delta [Parapedobacter sp. ISTM3]|uniref:DNA polymerase III subunit delta n=1 Tax=Parapedobacter luteus TaxID=623280 RepID=A0A1T5CGB8_9SPHI|nr:MULTISPECIES: DNA polymerase III subunit delta [Parapedobacter]MBK1438926.1 DNA polymerase III subunit delta [Parapedobacter sp. ISTM3]SKB58489.1 DNA polymerase III, delta subunit [Parapedobacter luteus]